MIPLIQFNISLLYFEIFSDGLRLGTLKISKGSIEWFASGHQYSYHLTWKDFDNIMRENGTSQFNINSISAKF